MTLTPGQLLSLSLDPAYLFELRGLSADPWQRELLRTKAPRILLNCCRQAGKSTAVAALALHTVLFMPKSLVLLLSTSQRQSSELFRKVLEFYKIVKGAAPAAAITSSRLELKNGSRVVSLPGREGTIRSYSAVAMLIIDEAAQVPEDLYRAVRPMLAVSGGRLICLSTPYGQRGFFHHAWIDRESDWLRFEIHAEQIKRITQDHLARELREFGRSWYDQEYGCSFASVEGLVYPGFEECIVNELPENVSQLVSQLWDARNGAIRVADQTVPATSSPKRVGGIDFGFTDPFAAVWGICDAYDVLWIAGEHYERQQSLVHHVAKLPRRILWAADPSEPLLIRELIRADFKVRKAINAKKAGIAAVTARLQSGRLKVFGTACPNLLAESKLYRYDRKAAHAAERENPVDKDDHALDALRYLISRLDEGFLARQRHSTAAESSPPAAVPGHGAAASSTSSSVKKKWLSIYNEELWTRIY